MEYINFLKLTRFNGTEKYQFKMGGISQEEADHVPFLSFKIETNKCLRSLSDTRDLKALPTYEVSIPGKDYSDLKKGAKFQLKKSYDKETEKDYATLYYVECQGVENNQIEIMAFEKEKYLVKITGFTTDINFFDGSKPPTELEILGYFKKNP